MDFMTNKEFTHLSKSGVKMVEVGNKAVVNRTATAKGKIHLQRDTIELIRKEEIKKGNVITTAQIAAISAVKSTHHLIPLCHSLKITGVNVDFEVDDDFIETEVTVRFAYCHRMVDTMHVRGNDKQSQQPVKSKRQKKITMIEHRCGIQNYFKNKHSKR